MSIHDLYIIIVLYLGKRLFRQLYNRSYAISRCHHCRLIGGGGMIKQMCCLHSVLYSLIELHVYRILAWFRYEVKPSFLNEPFGRPPKHHSCHLRRFWWSSFVACLHIYRLSTTFICVNTIVELSQSIRRARNR